MGFTVTGKNFTLREKFVSFKNEYYLEGKQKTFKGTTASPDNIPIHVTRSPEFAIIFFSMQLILTTDLTDKSTVYWDNVTRDCKSISKQRTSSQL